MWKGAVLLDDDKEQEEENEGEGATVWEKGTV